MNHFDVIIIGGGPIGIACGLEAKKRKLSYLVIEKGTIVNSLFNYPEGMTFFSSSDKLEIDDIPFISNNAKPHKSESLEYYRRIVTSKNLNINLFEKVEDVKHVSEIYQVKTSKNIYTAKNVVIATGFYDIPNLLNIPGEELPKVSHYYKTPHFYSLQNVAIVGASNSSVDAALEIYRKGGNVTMIIRDEKIGERVKYWVRPDIINRIEEGSIGVYFNSEITEIFEDKICLYQKGELVTIKNDYVLALTGYQPNFNFLEKMGVKLSQDSLKKPVYNIDTMETNRDGIYLAGVICGGLETNKWFIENSRIHAPLIMNDIKSKINNLLEASPERI
ncbi:MAG: putative YpdA family bacillithiol system oxidoreductase [Patiriisocius sp.]|jgi:putative YpdA family bacillithiol system oxidoreductase